MSHQLPPLVWIKAFEASARHMSFTAAARELGLTQAAISYQVKALESHLGAKLFERLPRGVKLTDMGGAYLPSVRKTFEELTLATVGLFGHPSLRTVNLRVPVSFAVLWIAPRLHRFHDLHPDIDVRLFSAIWADVLPAENVDLEIRFGTGSWQGHRSELLTNEGAVIACHRGVANHGSRLQRLQDLAQLRLVHVVGHEDLWGRAFQQAGPDVLDINTLPERAARARTDTSLAALQLAASGGYAAIVLRSYVQESARTLPLHIPIDLELPVDQAHYLLLPDRRQALRPETGLLRDWLLDEARNG